MVMAVRDLESLASQAGTDADVAMKAVIDKEARVAVGQFNLSQVAGTYDLLTAAGGDVLCEVQQVYVKTAATGLTSALVATNHPTPKSVVASTLLAALVADAILTVATTPFVLPSGKKIQGTIVGTGTAGLVLVIVKYTPLAPGATLA